VLAHDAQNVPTLPNRPCRQPPCDASLFGPDARCSSCFPNNRDSKKLDALTLTRVNQQLPSSFVHHSQIPKGRGVCYFLSVLQYQYAIIFYLDIFLNTSTSIACSKQQPFWVFTTRPIWSRDVSEFDFKSECVGIPQFFFANPKSKRFIQRIFQRYLRRSQIFNFPFGKPFFIIHRTRPEKISHAKVNK